MKASGNPFTQMTDTIKKVIQGINLEKQLIIQSLKSFTSSRYFKNMLQMSHSPPQPPHIIFQMLQIMFLPKGKV